MKKLLLMIAMVAALFQPAKADLWSWTYYYQPTSWSEAKVWWQEGLLDHFSGYHDPEKYILYVGGEGRLPDSDEKNVYHFPFSYLHGGPYSWTLPWRVDGPSDLVATKDIVDQTSNFKLFEPRMLVVENGITHLGNWWFQGLWHLNEVIMPPSLQSVGEGAFKGCESLPLFECYNNVKTIGNRAFEGCKKLSTFNIYDVEKIEDYKISEAALSIGANAFVNCENLRYFNFTTGSTVGDKAFAKT
jgi:hypothetical protein